MIRTFVFGLSISLIFITNSVEAQFGGGTPPITITATATDLADITMTDRWRLDMLVTGSVSNGSVVNIAFNPLFFNLLDLHSNFGNPVYTSALEFPLTGGTNYRITYNNPFGCTTNCVATNVPFAVEFDWTREAGTVFPGDRTPGTQNGISFTFNPASGVTSFGQVAVSLSTVPEPGVTTLLLTSLVPLSCMRRRGRLIIRS